MTPESAPRFACHHLGMTYETRNGHVVALDDITFGVDEREFVCLVGPSGCGKTTLLKIIAALQPPTTGEVVFTGPVNGQPQSALVFQEHAVFPWMSVIDNVAFGLEMQGVGKRERHDRARAFIDRVGLSAFAGHHPHELSVGMRQRVGIARAFVSGVPILLMDEPFGSLDAQTRLVLQQELLRIWKDDRKLVLYVTHDLDEAFLLGDRILVMSGRPGRILEEIPIPLGRPRSMEDLANPEISELKWHVWRLIEAEVRKGLSLPR